jgi:hypothetical protein
MNGYGDQVARELLALTGPDAEYPRIDREYVREMLAEAFDLGVDAGVEYGLDGGHRPANPFRVAQSA